MQLAIALIAVATQMLNCLDEWPFEKGNGLQLH